MWSSTYTSTQIRLSHFHATSVKKLTRCDGFFNKILAKKKHSHSTTKFFLMKDMLEIVMEANAIATLQSMWPQKTWLEDTDLNLDRKEITWNQDAYMNWFLEVNNFFYEYLWLSTQYSISFVSYLWLLNLIILFFLLIDVSDLNHQRITWLQLKLLKFDQMKWLQWLWLDNSVGKPFYWI